MRESSFWHALKTGLTRASNNEIFLQRHEDRSTLGIPDVSFCYKGVSGWIELKYVAKIPVKSKTPLALTHFTQHQKFWLRDYCEAGGIAWILIRIKDYIFLVKGEDALKLEFATMNDVITTAKEKFLAKRVDYAHLLSLICDNFSNAHANQDHR